MNTDFIPKLTFSKGRKADVSVVAMTYPDPALIQNFITLYRHLGVQQFHIYIDFDGNNVMDLHDPASGVRLNLRDEAFWKAEGKKRPVDLGVRTVMAFKDAYSKLETEWLICADIDEIVVPPREDLHGMLKAVPADVQQLHARSWEVFWKGDARDSELFSGRLARRPVKREDKLEAALKHKPALFRMLARGKEGIFSHKSGKYVLRRGIEGFKPTLHAARRETETGSEPIPMLGDYFYLLHFDALSRGAWIKKQQGRSKMALNELGWAEARQVQTQIFALASKQGQQEMFELMYKEGNEAYLKGMVDTNALIEFAFKGLPSIHG